MRNFKLLAIAFGILFSACSQEHINCLENKEVFIQTIRPSAIICSVPPGHLSLNVSWDTSHTEIMSECDANYQLSQMQLSWNDHVRLYAQKAEDSPEDSLYYSFVSANPAVYTILDEDN